MLETLRVEGTDDNPEVVLDQGNGRFKISGMSLPEDASTFYNPIISWVSDYAQNPNDETIFEFDMEYFNSSSARKLVEIIIELEHLVIIGKQVKVVWKFSSKDEIMEERGEEISSIVEVPFVFQPY